MRAQIVVCFAVAATACVSFIAGCTPAPAKVGLSGTWSLVMRDDSGQVLSGTIFVSDDSATAGHFSIQGVQDADPCLPDHGDFTGAIRSDSVLLWLNPSGASCSIRLFGVKRVGTIQGKWCIDNYFDPCGGRRSVWFGKFRLDRI